MDSRPIVPAPAGTEPAQAPRDGGLRSQLLQRFTLVFVVVALLGNIAALTIYREFTATANRKVADNRLELERVADGFLILTGM